MLDDQTSPELFNKAMLMNAGYMEASARQSSDPAAGFDCFVFHDVT